MRSLALALALFMPSTIAPAIAGDAAAGRAKAIKCKQCHGLDGIGKQQTFPNIGGQKEAYLAIQMKAFQTGERQNTMMSFIAEGLSAEDIADLAAYYASIPFTVTLPD